MREPAAPHPFDPFDVVLFDPPYDSAPGDPGNRGDDDQVDAALAAAADVMASDGVLVLEHARKRRAPDAAGRLVRTREVSAGDSALAFYACQP